MESSRRSAVMAWMRLARVYQKVDAASAASFRSAGLSVGQFDVLARLGAHAGITQQELADSLLVTKGNISQIVERMEGRRLLTRSAEGRTKCLRLTPEGRRLYRSLVPAQESLIRRQFSCLSHQELSRLHEVLRKLDRSMERL